MNYSIAGKRLTCSHCGGIDFQKGKVQLDTVGMTFFNFDWLNTSADTFLCDGCGRIEWFAAEVTKKQEALNTETDCLACGEVISKDQDSCSKCGWTYK